MRLGLCVIGLICGNCVTKPGKTMVKVCCVCKKEYIAGGGRSYHSVPKSPNSSQKWCSVLEKCGILKISGYTNICSDHFMNEDFYVTPAGRRKLRKGALPSIFSACGSVESSKSQSDQCPGIASTSEVWQYPAAKRTKLESHPSIETGSPSPKGFVIKTIEVLPSMIETHFSEQSSHKQTTIRSLGDVHSSDSDKESLKNAKFSWSVIQHTVKNQRMEIRRLRQATLRMIDKIYNIETLLKHMKNEYGVS